MKTGIKLPFLRKRESGIIPVSIPRFNSQFQFPVSILVLVAASIMGGLGGVLMGVG